MRHFGRPLAFAAGAMLLLSAQPTSLEGQQPVAPTVSLTSSPRLPPFADGASGRSAHVAPAALPHAPDHPIVQWEFSSMAGAGRERRGLGSHLLIGALAGGILGGAIAQVTVHRGRCEGCLPKWALVTEGVVLGAAAGALGGLVVHVIRRPP